MKRMSKKVLAVFTAILMLCSLFIATVPSVSALAGAKKGGDGKIYAWGCDMSQWNVNGATYTNYDLVDFKKMKADGCSFVILRIGDQKPEYDRKADPTFVTLYNMAREAGMHVGAYYYCYKTTRAGAVSDAQFCIDIMEKNNMYFEYPIYFDVEAKNQESLSTSKLVDLCLGWCETMEAAGYFPGVYSTEAHSLTELKSSSLYNYDTWVARVKTNGTGAQFNPKTEKTEYQTQYGMWQYKWYNTTKTPSYDGSYWVDSNGNCPLDCNVAYRDYPTIMQTYGYNNVVTKHTISFDSNGGSAVEAVKVKDGEKLTKPADPTRYGFSFAGWYCNPELTDPYDFNTSVPYDFTLYAKWDEAYWGANNNLMPNSTQMQLNDFNGQGAIWPYWNADEYNSVTMYNGVTNDDNWSWPSAYMQYENSFDSVNSGYLYVKKDGTAQFNVVLTYMDKNGELRDLYLSEVANLNGTDFAAGYLEEFYDVGSYIRNLGHAPASGNVKFTRVTYYVIGAKDSYVKLYDLKFTQRFDVAGSYVTMYNKTLTQDGVGAYTYNDGVLTMEADTDSGYSVTFTPNASFKPAEYAHMLMDLSATAPFNVTMELTRADGTATMEFRNEFFNVFSLDGAPTALPAGNHVVDMNMVGYYEWNGGIPAESTVKSVTVTLCGKGTLTLKALQASRFTTITYVNDGESASGDNRVSDVPSAITSPVFKVGAQMISAIDCGTTVADFLSGINEAAFVTVRDANGNAMASDAALGTGAIVAIVNDGKTVCEYAAVVSGDVNGDGKISSVDARMIVLSTVDSIDLNNVQNEASDIDGNDAVTTSDVRTILLGLTV